MNTLVLILAILIMLVGVAGSVLPVIPGIPLVFLGILGYGWYEGFRLVTTGYLAIMGGLALLSIIVDYLSGVLGAQRAGSSKAGMYGALLGAIVGLFFGPVGILIGPWIGAFFGEYVVLQDVSRAVKVATGTVIAVFAGIAFKVVLGLCMLISFLIIVL